MAKWVKCTSSLDNTVAVWVNLDFARTLIRQASTKETIIRFGEGDHDIIEVVEKPEKILGLERPEGPDDDWPEVNEELRKIQGRNK